DYSGKLVAGLFDSTPLTVQQIQGHNPTVFSWQDADDLTRIAAANPLVSQASVVDNTWHHVAFVANAKGQSLYLDGMLQGTSQPLTHDRYTANVTSSTPSLTVKLTDTPQAGAPISGSIWEDGDQGQQGYRAYTFAGTVGGEIKLSKPTYNRPGHEL